MRAISKAGFEGVELRRDETFSYLEDHTVEDLKRNLEKNNLECITFNAIELFSLCPEKEFERILKYTERLMKIGNQINCDTIIAVPSFLEEPYISDSEINLYHEYGFLNSNSHNFSDFPIIILPIERIFDTKKFEKMIFQ